MNKWCHMHFMFMFNITWIKNSGEERDIQVIHTGLGLTWLYVYYQGFAIISGQENAQKILVE